jgi:hypothetical protein
LTSAAHDPVLAKGNQRAKTLRIRKRKNRFGFGAAPRQVIVSTRINHTEGIEKGVIWLLSNWVILNWEIDTSTFVQISNFPITELLNYYNFRPSPRHTALLRFLQGDVTEQDVA